MKMYEMSNMSLSENRVYPQISKLQKENDDKPLDFGIPYFKTKPYVV